MSKYTTELRFICENLAGLSESVGYTDTQQIIDKAIPKLFDFDFPIFDSSYKNVLCNKIITRYYTREIGEETYGLWKFRLRAKLNMIMPYYNKLYELEQLKINPLFDVDYYTKHQGEGSSKQVAKGTTNGVVNGKSTESIEKTDSQEMSSEETSTDQNNRERGLMSSGRVDETKNGSADKTINTKLEKDYKGSVDVEENTEGTSTGETNGTSSTTDVTVLTGTHKDVSESTDTKTGASKNTDSYSDTPQGSLQNIENNSYLTNARIKNDTSSDTDTYNGTKTATMDDNTTRDLNTTTKDDTTGSTKGKRTSSETSSNSGSDTNTGTENTTTNETKISSSNETVNEKENANGYKEVKSNSNTSGKTTQNVESARGEETNTTRNDTTDATSTDEYLNHTYGKVSGTSYAKMIMEYREALINIDELIVNELECLFMMLW